MGYHVSESMCRVDIFKSSGKWDRTEMFDMGKYYNATIIHAGVRDALQDAGITLHEGYHYVILEPYHKNAHPIMIKPQPGINP